MKKKILVITLAGLLSAMFLSACGDKEPASGEAVIVEENTETVSGGSVSLDTSDESIENTEKSDTKPEDIPDKQKTDLPPEDVEVEDAAPVEKPETIQFIIVQDTRDGMFTLTNTEKQTLKIDTASENGYIGTMAPKAGEYETGASGYYTLPYSSSLTLSEMDDEIVYVSAEYPHMLSVAVQYADTVVLNEDRTVVITGKDDTSVFSYRVWMPSIGVKKEMQNELLVGQGAGSLKVYWDDSKSKISVQQLTGSPAEMGDINSDSGDSDVASVDWRTACPWADKIATGIWSDGADLSNVSQLKEGIMAAKFTPVSDIEEDSAKTVTLTFYDSEKKKLGVMKYWQTGKHVIIDDKKFDYDTFGLE